MLKFLYFYLFSLYIFKNTCAHYFSIFRMLYRNTQTRARAHACVYVFIINFMICVLTQVYELLKLNENIFLFITLMLFT